MTMQRIDKYEILERIAHGGMGTIYKALHPQFKKYVAIKEIRSDLASHPGIRQQFEREAELLADLPPHPNIVTVRDALVWEGRLYLVMDYIDGGTLADLIVQGGVEPRRAARLLDQILSGLVVIHRRGIVHRDIKPGNILIDREGVPHISDFGIATSMIAQAPGQRMVTAKYAAPEAVDPSLGRAGVEAQIDLYATGVLAYEMLLGKNRFRETLHEVYNGRPEVNPAQWLHWHTDLTRSARNLSEVDPTIPEPLANTIERLMAKDVNERYRSADDARRDLAVWLGQRDDARGNRTKPPSDDATVPLDQISGSGPHAARGGSSRRATRQNRSAYKETGPLRERPAAAPEFTEPPPAPPARAAVPRWVWWAGGGALFALVLAVALISLLLSYPGFTLVVQGAPPGSDVYVDGVRRGVPTARGEIRVLGLEAGRSREVQVKCDGYEEFKQTVTGEDGKDKIIAVNLTAAGRVGEIDYNGPMILIPAGEFVMGDNDHESDEKPAHRVKLPDYYIDKYEVTNAQYKKFCDATGRPYPTKHPMYEQLFKNNPDFPVIGISWDDADEYARWIGKRLPTEEEWEKAASWDPNAQKKRRWSWGDDPDPSRANLSGNPGRTGQHPAGASAYGVQDMTGNASEWVDAFYQPYEGNQDSNADFGTKERVVRGGSFTYSIDDARTTFREHAPPGKIAEIIEEAGAKKSINSRVGFRCAVLATDPRLLEYRQAHRASK
jgi:serine/threonine protein kinase/formylglycine-generating enzyme required for sulfatase activity